MNENASEDRGKFSNLTRRQFLGATGVGAASLVLAKSSLVKSALKTPSASGARRAFGVTLPSGAAPASQQFLIAYQNSVGATYKALDFYETVYSRAPLADNFEISLVRINQNYQIVSGTATHWAQTSPTTWEFYIKPGIMWSDGNELTANDYVETFRYSADPKHAWDFSWYWSGVIKNYTEAVAGKAPVNSIGVAVGKNKYTFVVTTEGPVAFIPNAMLYSMPLSAAGLAKYGNGLYNINPATCISCGPYILKTFNPTSEVVLAPNPKYSAPYRPYITHQKAKIFAGARVPPAPRDRRGGLQRHPGALDDRPGSSQENLQALEGNAGYQPTGLPGLLRVLQDQGQAVQQLEGAAGLRPLRQPQPDHQRPAPRAGRPGLRLPDGGVPVRSQQAARTRHQLRPGEGSEATGPGRLPEGPRASRR